MKKLKEMDKYVDDILNYVVLSFDFIRELPPSIIIPEDKRLQEIQKSKNVVLDDLKDILNYLKEIK